MRKRQKKTIILICSVIVFIFIAVFGAELWLGHKIKRIIENEPAALVNGPYNGTVGRVGVSLLNRSVNIRDVNIKGSHSDSSVDSSFLRSLDMKCRNIIVEGIKFKKRNGTRIISVKNIRINSPEAIIALNNIDPHKKTENKSAGKRKFALEDFNSSDVEIKNGYITIERPDKAGHDKYTLDGLNLKITDLKIDSLSGSKPYFDGDARMTVKKITYMFQHDLMVLTVDNVSVNSKKGNFSVGAVNLDPQITKYDFAYKDPDHTDWTRVSSGKITGIGLDFNKLITENTLKVDSISVNNVEVESYKNRKIQVRNKVKPLFYQSLQRMDMRMDIPVIKVSNVDVAYEELAVDGEMPGRIRFNNINGTFYGLTNIVKEDGKDYFKLVASAKLEEKGQLDATFLFPVSASTNHFEVTGKLGYMPLPYVNGMVEPLAKARIDEGQINSFDFHISGTSSHSYVRMTLLYSDLDVTLLKEKKDGEIKERKFLSFIADTFIIKPSNPHRGDIRNVMAEAERDPYRSQFNYLWKSLMAGIKKTIM